MLFDGVRLETSPTVVTPDPLSLRVRMPDGGILSPAATSGARLIDALAAFGIPIRQECDDRVPSAAARVHVAPSWADLLPPPDSEERAILAALGTHDGTSRLLRKVVLTPNLDGLELALPWDALVPQTYWIAG